MRTSVSSSSLGIYWLRTLIRVSLSAFLCFEGLVRVDNFILLSQLLGIPNHASGIVDSLINLIKNDLANLRGDEQLEDASPIDPLHPQPPITPCVAL